MNEIDKETKTWRIGEMDFVRVERPIGPTGINHREEIIKGNSPLIICALIGLLGWAAFIALLVLVVKSC